ncbi:MAG TPA: 4Fe-4S dicluster domain-containing protein [bacterium]|nr:4Fe-4S dicluster domain-containing protein [bacterium]
MAKDAVKHDKIAVDRERCKGCGLCVLACDRKILAMSKKLNKKGLHYVEWNDLTNCKSCTLCAIICPEAVIEIYKES